MADFRGTTTVQAPAQQVFDYLSDVGNLPEYMAMMTSARRGDGDAVHTTASLPDGSEVEGEAWFRTDADARRVEWGAQGPHDYRGELEVTGDGGTSQVTMRLHTTRAEDDDEQVQGGIDETLADIARLAARVLNGRADGLSMPRLRRGAPLGVPRALTGAHHWPRSSYSTTSRA